MNQTIQALTITGKGKLRDIQLPVEVGLAVSLGNIFGIAETKEKAIAIWDTGANGTAISTRLANKLQLQTIRMTQVHGAGGLKDSRVFKIDVRIPNPLVNIIDVEATEFVDNGVCDLLIGMDIINLGDFSITNADNKTVFSFRIPPADKHIDYVQELNDLNAARGVADLKAAQKIENQARIRKFKKQNRHRH